MAARNRDYRTGASVRYCVIFTRGGQSATGPVADVGLSQTTVFDPFPKYLVVELDSYSLILRSLCKSLCFSLQEA